MNEILRLKDVSISIKDKSFFNLNLAIRKGDFVIIKGSNSVGKSLLLRMLYLKILPSKGSFYLYEKLITKKNKFEIIEFRKKIGVILQNDFLIPFFSVYQNIELASEIQNKKDGFNKRMSEILDWMGLKQIQHENIINLSNGQKQKVVVARALINNPSIIIADQPENNLDEKTVKKIYNLFDSLNKLGTTIIMTSSFNIDVTSELKVINL